MQSSHANESKWSMQTYQFKACKYIDASLLQSKENMQSDQNKSCKSTWYFFTSIKIKDANLSKHDSIDPNHDSLLYFSYLLILSLCLLFAWLHDLCFVIAWTLFCFTLHDCMHLAVCVSWFDVGEITNIYECTPAQCLVPPHTHHTHHLPKH